MVCSYFYNAHIFTFHLYSYFYFSYSLSMFFIYFYSKMEQLLFPPGINKVFVILISLIKQRPRRCISNSSGVLNRAMVHFITNEFKLCSIILF